jgi:RNA polymerase sigma factor (sigma-70 family)
VAADGGPVRPRRQRRARIGDAFPALLAAAQRGRPWALEQLFQAMAPVVVGYLRVQGSPDPEDLTNEVFLNVVSSLQSFAGEEESFWSWLFTIAHRRLIDERRAAGRRIQLTDWSLDELDEARGGDVEDEAMVVLSVERVRHLCERLSPDQRDVLLLRLVAALTTEQVAEALGKSPTAVQALQLRGVAAVRRHLEREGVSL